MSIEKLSRILLIEDDPDIQEVARIALEAVGGFTLEVCSNGKEGLEAVVGFAPDLILLDVMMPGMDGPTTLRALRHVPEAASIPVVFLTAKVQPAEKAFYRELGAAEVIPKPFDPLQLSSKVEEVWRRSACNEVVC